MRYALAIVCPPLALMTCHRLYQAIVAAILYAVAIATARWGIGAFVEFFLILWACNAVGDDQAAREARAFIKTVKPIPVIHG
jgi:hypothetical protein